MSHDHMVIRPVSEAECDQLEKLQQAIWGMGDMEVVPGRVLHALQFNGAILLGAYDGSKFVGFVLGVLAILPGTSQFQLYSVMMGVLPDYQNQQIGYRLKRAQMSAAMALNIACITWTYDPLESRNAWFNIGKLGAICRRYLPNFHGQMSGINAGLPSDRFYVEWHITNDQVLQRVLASSKQPEFQGLLLDGAVVLNKSELNEQNLPTPPAGFPHNAPSTMLLVEIPTNFQQIKRQNLPLAQQWREHTGQIFPYYFQLGYIVTDFIKQIDDSGREHAYYLLTHQYP